MGSFDGKEKEIKFPVICHYKIIANRSDDIQTRIEAKLKDAGVMHPIQLGHESSERRYITFNLELMVHSREYMNEIDQLLRSIDGVKMVL
jgi:putative lipoic acid-binding regulatory protein